MFEKQLTAVQPCSKHYLLVVRHCCLACVRGITAAACTAVVTGQDRFGAMVAHDCLLKTYMPHRHGSVAVIRRVAHAAARTAFWHGVGVM